MVVVFANYPFIVVVVVVVVAASSKDIELSTRPRLNPAIRGQEGERERKADTGLKY